MFSGSATAYDRFMGRYSTNLAPLFADFAEVIPGQRVLDVGCGPGALTTELARRVGERNVGAVDPVEQFVAACRVRVPGADVRAGPAERIPFDAGEFDAALSQLVLSFVTDADAMASEMRRVVRRSGTVAACMWGGLEEHELLGTFWGAAFAVDPNAEKAEKVLRYRTSAEIEDLFRRAGLSSIEPAPLTVTASYQNFDELWDSIDDAPGSVGAYYARLGPAERERLRAECARRVGSPTTPFEFRARAWAVRGRA
jgi:ubiquinone/menaquinone biosynthesis C-methylase UbiE